MFAEEVAVVEKKIQSYAARMSALETGVAEARRGLAALEKAQEASAQELAKYLQELTVIQKRVFGALLAEGGAELCYAVGRKKRASARGSGCRASAERTSR